jgi:hypothetical protein
MPAPTDWATLKAIEVQRSLEGSPYDRDDVERIANALRTERAACAKIVEREVWIRSGGVAARNVANAVRLGRTDVSDESMEGFTSTE